MTGGADVGGVAVSNSAGVGVVVVVVVVGRHGSIVASGCVGWFGGIANGCKNESRCELQPVDRGVWLVGPEFQGLCMANPGCGAEG